MKEKKTGKELIAVCLLVLSLVLITVGTTFAFFTYSRHGQTENTLHTGNLTFVYDESKSKDGGVSIENAFPMSDEEGKALEKDKKEVFDFDVRAKTQGAAINYEIYLTKEKESTLPEYTIKTYLTTVSNGIDNDISTGLPTKTNLNLYSELYDSGVPSLVSELKDVKAKTLYRETIPDGQSDYTKTFRYRMWIDEDANKVINGSWKYNNMAFSVKVNVYAQNDTITDPAKPEVYKDESGANYPALVTGLIPVTYDKSQKSWVKANLYKDWYDYDIQEWANAVTIDLDEDGSSTTRENYQKADPGTPINMEDINTMWVWIPRYEYKYTNLGDQYAGGTKEQPGEIEVNFLNGVNDTPSEPTNYKVHPAFTFGDDKLTGLWYGKFETSNQEGIYGDNDDVRANSSELTPIIKPNIPSWRNIQVANMFYAAFNMKLEANALKYGFNSDGSIDTHMSKNSEWGAVAYLSQSKYGKYHVDQQEVLINSCSSYMTGVAGCDEDYTSTNGLKTSTTGNITGVYDMSGGSWDYVMGVLTDDEGLPRSGWTTSYNSGFNGVLYGGGTVSDGKDLPDAKYYDLYTSMDPISACNGQVCYGHALSETGGWYLDNSKFVDSPEPWFGRGGSCTNYYNSGVFSSLDINGATFNSNTFRLVLASIGI